LALASCGSGEADDGLIGTWTDQEGFIEYEFKSDGALVVRFMDQEEQTTYSADDGKLSLADMETGEQREFDYSIDGDTLTLKADGEEETLLRKNGTTAEAAGSAEDATEKTAAGSDLGMRENPIPMGQEAQVGDRNVKVVSATLDATSSLLAEDEFSDPPQEGSQYVLVTIDATYTGTESSTFWMDMTLKLVGGKGNTFPVP
jgi:hypothetical protein